MSELNRTPLYDLHASLGARFVPFAGWEMPVQFEAGVMKEHLHTREHAGLFDVSHMGQVILRPESGDAADAARALEALVPADIVGLGQGRQRYALFTNDAGGILDDLMVANRGDHLFLVVNAARAAHDIAHLENGMAGHGVKVEPIIGRALLALQGPVAESVLAAHVPDAAGMRFMDVIISPSAFGELWISRSGYTGEDGYEISVPADAAEAFARAILDDARVLSIGLGARDSLRLEAGLCLYGSDIDATTTPVEAALTWSIGKARRAGGARAGGFPGADRILGEIANGAPRKRVGFAPEGRAPMRAGTVIFDGDTEVGHVTSGAFGPTTGTPVSMGYVSAALAETGTALDGEVRGKRLPVRVADLPFVAPGFKR